MAQPALVDGPVAVSAETAKVNGLRVGRQQPQRFGLHVLRPLRHLPKGCATGSSLPGSAWWLRLTGPLGLAASGTSIGSVSERTDSVSAPIGVHVSTAVGDSDRPAAPGERLADWADSRLGIYSLAKSNMRKIFPDHWSFMLGEVCLYSFIIIILTGIYLTLFFHPSMNEVVYHGSYIPLQGIRMSEAFSSTLDISFDVRGGLLVRQIHHWSALVFIAAMLLHTMRVFFNGSYRKPREANWIFGFLLLVLGMFTGFTGYSLPDDLLSGTGVRFMEGAVLSVPIVGTYLSMFLFGGEFPGGDFVARFYSIHILLLPGIMLGLLTVHMILVFYHKHTQYSGPGRREENVVGSPLLPIYVAKAGGFFFLVFGVLSIIAAVATINPIWAIGPYRPDQVSTGAQPDWYMGFSEGLIRIMPGWEVNFAGHTLVLGVFIPLILFPMVLMIIALYPFIESWATPDTREHHLTERPRNAPVRTGLGVAWIALYLVLLMGEATISSPPDSICPSTTSPGSSGSHSSPLQSPRSP